MKCNDRYDSASMKIVLLMNIFTHNAISDFFFNDVKNLLNIILNTCFTISRMTSKK